MQTKAPNLVQLLFSGYKLILEGEPPPNTPLSLIGAGNNYQS